MKTIDGANIHAVRIFAANALFSDNKSHKKFHLIDLEE
mgnify:CR=1 FL=1